MSYKHGIYGTVAVTNNPTGFSQSTIPAYIGSAPVHRIGSNKVSDYVNKPFVVSSLREAKELGLYSDDWNTYTLCEAIHAHFMNGAQSVAPIILVNVLNPETDTESKAGTATVTMKKMGTKFVGYINDPLCISDGIALTATSADGVTIGTVTYKHDGDTVVIEAEVTLASGKEATSSFTANATYNKIGFTDEKFTKTAVEAALSSLDYCEQLTGYIPNIIAAPGISDKPELHSLLVQKAMDKLSGKWNFIVLSDIPKTNETYAAAIDWKAKNAYGSKYDKVFWPAVAYGDKVYHMSTIGAYMMQYMDTQNSDVPYVSISNKPIFCDRAVVGATNSTLLISEEEANGANQVGITTVNSVKRGLRMWGAHMANYNYATVGDIASEDRFDTSIRMMMYILNYLQYQHINEIDSSFTRKDIDSIVNSVQTWLDSLVNDGMLLYAAISFNNESNSDADIANGDFEFDLEVTYSVIAKSITFKLQYTSTGIVNVLNDGGAEE